MPQLANEGDLPILQEDEANPVWSDWNVSWRDESLGVFNLTTFSLDNASNYAELKAILVAAAQGEDVSGRLVPLPE